MDDELYDKLCFWRSRCDNYDKECDYYSPNDEKTEEEYYRDLKMRCSTYREMVNEYGDGEVVFD